MTARYYQSEEFKRVGSASIYMRQVDKIWVVDYVPHNLSSAITIKRLSVVHLSYEITKA